MANSDETGPPHGKTKLIKKFTPIDYGPLNTYRESHIRNFRSGTYMMTTPVHDGLTVYRLYGGTAQEVGHYWTVEERDGNMGFQLDYAMVPSWGSTLAKDTKLLVPRGILLFEGYVASQEVHPGSQVICPIQCVLHICIARAKKTVSVRLQCTSIAVIIFCYYQERLWKKCRSTQYPVTHSLSRFSAIQVV